MDAERWRRIEGLYEAALAEEPSQRAALLEESCGGDASLRSDVESLLLHDENAGRLLNVPPREKPREAGQRVTHYEIQEKLGEGGMGVVYKARDTRLGRSVALKFVKAQFSERFQREARAIAALNHPHIATLHDVGEHEGAPFLALEYLPGGTLRDRIRAARNSGQHIPVGEIIDWAASIAEGLAHAHRHGIVHRDVKSANVMFGLEGLPKLTDFGLAKVAGSLEESISGMVVGTVTYMSPEQASGGTVDQRSDLYSLGVVIYETVTGHLPFKGDSPAAVVHEIMNTEPPAPSRLRSDVSPALDGIVLRLLAKAPGRRYRYGEEVARDLRALGPPRKQSLFETVTATLREPLSWSRMTRRRLAASAAVALLAAAGAYTGRGPVRQWWRARALPKQIYLAVLPFQSIAGGAEQQAFCDGLTVTLTTALTKHGSFCVLPADYSRRLDSAGVARAEFGVNLVISGSVQQRGDQVRMTINLIDAATKRQIDAEYLDWPRQRLPELEEGVFSKTADLLNLLWSRQETSLPPAGASQLPSVYDAYLRGRGFLYRWDQKGNLDKAVAEFETAVREDPNFALAQVGLAEAHFRRYQPTKGPVTLKAARSAAEQALKSSPLLASAHLWHGRVLAESGRRTEAITELQRAVELDRRDPAAYRELANVYQMQHRYPDAERVFKQAVAVRPNDWMTHSSLATFYTSQQRLGEAEVEFRSVIKVTPDNPFGYRNLAVVLIRLGKNGEAETMLRKALGLRPLAGTYSNLATLLMLEKRYAEAVSPMEKAAEIGSREAPREYRIWGNLGDAYWLAQWPPEKKQDAWRRAVEIAEPQLTGTVEDGELLSFLAKYHAKLGDRPSALRRISDALRFTPSAAVRYQAGLTYAVLGEYDRALTELTEAVRLKYSPDEIKQAPELLPLGQDPRFQKLIAKTNTR